MPHLGEDDGVGIRGRSRGLGDSRVTPCCRLGHGCRSFDRGQLGNWLEIIVNVGFDIGNRLRRGGLGDSSTTPFRRFGLVCTSFVLGKLSIFDIWLCSHGCSIFIDGEAHLGEALLQRQLAVFVAPLWSSSASPLRNKSEPEIRSKVSDIIVALLLLVRMMRRSRL